MLYSSATPRVLYQLASPLHRTAGSDVVERRLQMLRGWAPSAAVFINSPDDGPDAPQRLTCDLEIFENGQSLHRAPAQTCFDAPLTGPASDLYLTGLQVSYTVEPRDAGKSTRFDITLTDPDRGITVPLSVALQIEAQP